MKLSLLAMNFQSRKEVAMFDTIHLTNMLRSEVEGNYGNRSFVGRLPGQDTGDYP